MKISMKRLDHKCTHGNKFSVIFILLDLLRPKRFSVFTFIGNAQTEFLKDKNVYLLEKMRGNITKTETEKNIVKYTYGQLFLK